MYLDPGFGTMIIQFLIAAVAACGAYAVIFRNRIKAFFNKKKGVTDEPEAQADVDEAAQQAQAQVEQLSQQFKDDTKGA